MPKNCEDFGELVTTIKFSAAPSARIIICFEQRRKTLVDFFELMNREFIFIGSKKLVVPPVSFGDNNNNNNQAVVLYIVEYRNNNVDLK